MPLADRRAAPSEEAPDEEDNHRAYDGANQARAFSRLIPADRLAQIGGDKGSHDAKHGREDEALGLILSRGDQLSDDACNEANEDRPKDAHFSPPLFRPGDLPQSPRYRLPRLNGLEGKANHQNGR